MKIDTDVKETEHIIGAWERAQDNRVYFLLNLLKHRRPVLQTAIYFAASGSMKRLADVSEDCSGDASSRSCSLGRIVFDEVRGACRSRHGALGSTILLAVPTRKEQSSAAGVRFDAKVMSSTRYSKSKFSLT